MMILLGDMVTVTREVGGDVAVVSGRVSGIVQSDSGDLKFFYIKGIENSFWVSDGWMFDEEIEIEMGEENEI
jgi:3-deoxy-D-manno-octulosonate 8-phosphate phosphatase KdsC-like HAD superfamily phosphatase